MRWPILSALAVLTAGALVAVVELSGPQETSALPHCAHAAAAIERPATIPGQFPVPPGTVFTRSFRNVTSHGVPAVTGLLPLRLGEAVSCLSGGDLVPDHRSSDAAWTRVLAVAVATLPAHPVHGGST